jgi:hypothetical protein
LIVLRNNNVNDKVQLIWDGYNEFKKSEIFRSLDGNKSNAELIETITDINENSFNDLEIPKTSKLSYFIKIVTNEGVIESELNPIIIADYTFEVALVTLEDPVVKDDAIELSWSKFEGASGSEYQETPLAILEDINTINF